MAKLTGKELFTRAAEYIREKGHRKYTYGARGEEACLLGACRNVSDSMDGRDLRSTYATELRCAAETFFGVHTDENRAAADFLATWNDQEERTAEDVIQGLLKCAEACP